MPPRRPGTPGAPRLYCDDACKRVAQLSAWIDTEVSRIVFTPAAAGRLRSHLFHVANGLNHKSRCAAPAREQRGPNWKANQGRKKKAPLPTPAATSAATAPQAPPSE